MFKIFNCSGRWGRFNNFTFHPRSGNTITQRNGANDFLHERFFSRDSNDIEKFPKSYLKVEKNWFYFFEF